MYETEDFAKAAERFAAAWPTAAACAESLRRFGRALASVPIKELSEESSGGPGLQEEAGR